jgi:hypothetical protein
MRACLLFSITLSTTLSTSAAAQMTGGNQAQIDTAGAAAVIDLPDGGKAFRPGIKYLGGIGFPDFHDHETWANGITITADSVISEFADTTFHRIAFPVTGVTKILYGQAASRHVGRWVAVGVLVAPIALLGMFHKSRHHFIALSWMDGEVERGVYLEANKELFRPLLNTLSFRSGRPIYSSKKDREWLMTKGVVTQLDPESKDAND